MTRAEDIKNILHQHQRRRQKLLERQAYLGKSIDPAISIEIEDLDAEIQSLQTELDQIDTHKITPDSGQNLLADNEMLSIEEILQERMSPEFKKITKSDIRQIQSCSVARHLEEPIVKLLTNNGAFWGRLQNTSLLFGNNSEQVRYIDHNLRSRLVNTLFHEDRNKYIRLHRKLRNYYQKLNLEEAKWHHRIEMWYHDWCILPDDAVLEAALSKMFALATYKDQNSFMDIGQILRDIAREREGTRHLVEYGQLLQQGATILDPNPEWEEVFNFCSEILVKKISANF